MIKFGPSGNSALFFEKGYKHSEQSAIYTKECGLDLFEYSFGRGVNLSDEKAVSIGKAFKNCEIEISVHAPYFINFSCEEENVEKSFKYIADSARAVKLMGGNRVVFHPASQGKMGREEAVGLCLNRIKRLNDYLSENGLSDVLYFPETMGKSKQIGTVEEIAEMCKISDIFIPCVDFGHVNAREGGSLKTKEDYIKRLSYLIDAVGYEKMKHFHVHFSKIEYGAKGEIRHLTFEDEKFGPEFEPMIDAINQLKLEPHIICESAGTQDIDAVAMKSYNLKKN